MGNEAQKAKKKNNHLTKLKYTAICKVARGQGKIIRIEINHFKQIFKGITSINQFENEIKQ